MDKRTVLAFTISLAILLAWTFLFTPQPPPATAPAPGAPAAAAGASSEPPTPQEAAAGAAGAVGATADTAASKVPTSAGAGAAKDGASASAPEANIAPRHEAPEGAPPTIVETPFARIQIDSVGGTIRSWTLSGYRDDKGQPYELVSPASRASGIYPLQFSSGIFREYEGASVEAALALAGQKLGRAPAALQSEVLDVGRAGLLGFGRHPAVVRILNAQDPLDALNKARFVIERGPGSKPDRSEIVKLVYSDGEGLEASKTLEFSQDSYLVRMSAEVTRFRKPVPAKIVWGPGIGTPHRDDTAPYEAAVAAVGTRISRIDRHAVQAPGPVEGAWSWTGAEEQYFAAVFVPTTGSVELEVSPVFVESPPDKEATAAKAPAAAAPKAAPPKHLVVLVPTGRSYDLFAGPKDYQILGGIGLNLQDLVNFSYPVPLVGPMVGALATLLYLVLRALHTYVGNYGVAIILLTAAIKILFYPITQRTMVKMRTVQQQMTRLKPKADAIKKKYAKVKDLASRNKANEEVMELYRKEGVNPMASLGGCLPLLLQMPVLFALNRLLYVSIDLRQAPFLGWIQDLSWRDPYYITPIVMGLTMFLQQKLAMTNATDPQMKSQQRMMLFMPLFFTWTFLRLPSGLVLYWFVNNVLGIAQQVLINRQAKALEAQAAEAPGKA
jgi:YidC/Oxa1 family membrane protein insertase